MRMNKFISKLFILTTFIAAAIFCWNTFMPEKLQSNSLWFILIFIAAVTVGVHAFMTAPGKTPQQFIRHFMLITLVKLFLYLTVIGIYAYLYRPQALRFALSFFVLYFAFMIFEVISLTKFVKK